MAQNYGKQNKKPLLRFVNVPSVDIVGSKQTENILLSGYRHQYNSWDKESF